MPRFATLSGLLSVTLALSTVPACRHHQPAAATTQAVQKNWQDRGEYDRFEAITAETKPATRLEKLNQWKREYPSTAFIDERRSLYLTTYAALGRAADAVVVANEILAGNSKDFAAMYYMRYFTRTLAGAGKASRQVLQQGETASNGVLKYFGGITEVRNRPEIEALPHSTPGWIRSGRKPKQRSRRAWPLTPITEKSITGWAQSSVRRRTVADNPRLCFISHVRLRMTARDRYLLASIDYWWLQRLTVCRRRSSGSAKARDEAQ
jgi:hypothetical protein